MERLNTAISIDSIASQFSIPQVDPSRNYWLVRTSSGTHFADFQFNNYIAIGWDKITIDLMINNDEKTVKRIIESVYGTSRTQNDEDEDDDGNGTGKITTIYNKISRFVKELKKGDVVIIPSKNSAYLGFGVITSDAYEDVTYIERYAGEKSDSEIKPCSFYKRRNVKWLKVVPKHEADIYLLKSLSSHHSISSINDCKLFVNRTLYDFYSIDNEVHAIFRTENPKAMSFRELKEFVDSLSELLDQVSKKCDLRYNPDDISVKLNIHSPGILEIATGVLFAGAAISMVLLSINHYRHGGKFSVDIGTDETGKLKCNLSSESKGTLQYEQEKAMYDRFLKVQQELAVKAPELDSEKLIGQPKEPMN